MKRARLALQMLRYRAALMLWMFFLIGAARHGGLGALSWREGFGLVALACGYVSATTVNDICDQDVDRINHPGRHDRPLVSGLATVTDLWLVHGLSSAAALGAGILLGWPGVVLVLISLAINHAYSLPPMRLSRRTYLAPLLLTIAYVVLPYSFGVVAANQLPGGGDAMVLGALALLFIARIILKDFRDRVGDARYGKPTMLLRLGKTTTCVASGSAALLGTALLLIALESPIWLAASIAIHAALGLSALRLLARANEPPGEQFAIALAARMANGLLLTVLGSLMLRGLGAPEGHQVLLIATMTAVSATTFFRLLADPHPAMVTYRG